LIPEVRPDAGEGACKRLQGRAKRLLQTGNVIMTRCALANSS
jgi:hypothetical protein